jgi:hypothetical protein
MGGILLGGAPIAMHEHDPSFRSRNEYPLLQKLSVEWRKQGVGVLALLEPPYYDLRHQFANFVGYNRITLPILFEDYKARGATCKAYGCTKERWIYVLDPQGKIVYRGGLDPSAIRAALQQLGVS